MRVTIAPKRERVKRPFSVRVVWGRGGPSTRCIGERQPPCSLVEMPGLLERVIAMRLGAVGAALWPFAYFFCVLASYYVLRPVRETLGAAAGVEGLPWLFTGTFLAMLAAVPLFGVLASRFPRRTLLPLIYAFFIACILALFLLLRSGATAAWAPAAFFIWLSVFNLFVVSVFWSFMADVWR